METVADLATRLAHWLGRLPPEHERYRTLAAELTSAYGHRTDPLTPASVRAVERTAWTRSRHLVLTYDPDHPGPPDVDSPGWPGADPDDVRARAGGVASVSRTDGAWVLRLDALEPLDLARPYLTAAFALARGATGLVLDLRGNGGGDPATVALVAGWLLGGPPVPLSDVVYRRGRRRWSTRGPADDADPAGGRPTAVLVGPGTFSSGEALAYHLRARDRVVVVGERTPGGADHVVPIRLTRTVTGQVPEAYVIDAVTGTNWEGTGVVPDVACPADAALPRALAWLATHGIRSAA
jgi:hypothetical protein